MSDLEVPTSQEREVFGLYMNCVEICLKMDVFCVVKNVSSYHTKNHRVVEEKK